MGIEYLGLSSIKGPLVILEGVQDALCPGNKKRD